MELEKKQILPIHRIKGTYFDIDLEKEVFIKCGSPDHLIPFVQMEYQGTHYTLPYDLYTQKAPLTFPRADEDICLVKIPLLKELAPEGMAKINGISVSDLKNHSEFELRVNQGLYEQRRQGILPEINIRNCNYTVDLKSDMLSTAGNQIPLSAFHLHEPESNLRFAYFNTVTHQIENINLLKITELPGAHIIKLGIPFNEQIDPYGFALSGKQDVQNFLMNNPLPKRMEAIEIPLHQTEVKQFAKINWEREERKKFENIDRLNQRKIRRA